MPKRYIYIILGILITTIIVVAILYVMRKDSSTDSGVFSPPFGDAPAGSNINLPTNPSNNPTQGAPNTSTGQVRQISNSPVSGASIITSSSTLLVRYVERGTGHVFDYNVGAGTSRRISNTTIPKAQEVIWSGDRNSFIMRILVDSQIRNFSAVLLPPATSTPEGEFDLTGSYLVGQKISLAPSPDGKKIFYTSPNVGGGVVGTIASFDGSKPNNIWQFPTREWNISWPNNSQIFLTTKASAKEDGYSYILNSQTGEMTGVLSNVKGLIANPHPTLKYLLYSTQDGNKTALYLIDALNGGTNSITPTTLASKCTWSKNENLTVYCAVTSSLPDGLPDTWYKGLADFNDEIWKFNFETGETKLLANKAAFNSKIDAYNLEVSFDERLLIFQDKKTLSLWAVLLDLN